MLVAAAPPRPCARPCAPQRAQPAARGPARLHATKPRTQVEAPLAGVVDEGWKWDGSMQRWVRDKKYAGKSMTTVTPLSGGSYVVWPVMWSYLVKQKLKSIDVDEARRLASKGSAVLVDVRLADDYAAEHAAGAASAPLYRPTAGNGTWDKVKRFVMGALVMRATERNPGFLAAVEAATGRNKRKQVLVMCAVGGTLDTVVRVASTGKSSKDDKDRAFGRETRSLKACYELMRAGYSNVVHVSGGLGEWRYRGYDIEP